MLYYWNYLQSAGLQELWIKAGVGDTTRFIPIHTVALRIGKELCQVLTALHALSGCDYTSKVGTKVATLKACPTTYLQQFGLLTVPIDPQIAVAEEYLCQVIKKGTSYKTMNALRNFKYHQSKRAFFDKLPPASHSFRAHIMWAFYITNRMISLLLPNRTLFDPLHYGYEEIDEWSSLT